MTASVTDSHGAPGNAVIAVFVIPKAPPFTLTTSFTPDQKLKTASAGQNGLTTQIMQSTQLQQALASAEDRLP